VLVVGKAEALIEEDCLQGDAATNSVPMIGRRGERREVADQEIRDPTISSGFDQKRGLPYPPAPSISADWNWQKRADWDWHRERASRRRKLILTTPGPPRLKMTKRGPPRFGLPGHWSRGKRRPGLASLRSQLYQGFRFHPGPEDGRPMVNKRDPSFWDGAGEARQRWGGRAPSGPRWLQKRGLGEPGDETWQLNSVPFMGKRTMEKGQEALGQGDLMIRVPRETTDEEQEEEATNPWQFMLFDPRRVSRLSQGSPAGVTGLTKTLSFI